MSPRLIYNTKDYSAPATDWTAKSSSSFPLLCQVPASHSIYAAEAEQKDHRSRAERIFYES